MSEPPASGGAPIWPATPEIFSPRTAALISPPSRQGTRPSAVDPQPQWHSRQGAETGRLHHDRDTRQLSRILQLPHSCGYRSHPGCHRVEVRLHRHHPGWATGFWVSHPSWRNLGAAWQGPLRYAVLAPVPGPDQDQCPGQRSQSAPGCVAAATRFHVGSCFFDTDLMASPARSQRSLKWSGRVGRRG